MLGTFDRRYIQWAVTVLVTAVTLVACEMKSSSVSEGFNPVGQNLKDFTLSVRPLSTDSSVLNHLNRFVVTFTPPQGPEPTGDVMLSRSDWYETNPSEANTHWTKIAELRAGKGKLADLSVEGGKKYRYRLTALGSDKRQIEETREYQAPQDLLIQGETQLTLDQPAQYYRVVFTDGSRLVLAGKKPHLTATELKVLGTASLVLDRLNTGYGAEVQLQLGMASGKLTIDPCSLGGMNSVSLQVLWGALFDVSVTAQSGEVNEAETAQTSVGLLFSRAGIRNDTTVFLNGTKHRLNEIAGVYRHPRAKGIYLWANPAAHSLNRIIEEPSGLPERSFFVHDGHFSGVRVKNGNLEVWELPVESTEKEGLAEKIAYTPVSAQDPTVPIAIRRLVRLETALIQWAKESPRTAPDILISSDQVPNQASDKMVELAQTLSRHREEFLAYWERNPVSRVYFAMHPLKFDAPEDQESWIINPRTTRSGADLLQEIRAGKPPAAIRQWLAR